MKLFHLGPKFLYEIYQYCSKWLHFSIYHLRTVQEDDLKRDHNQALGSKRCVFDSGIQGKEKCSKLFVYNNSFSIMPRVKNLVVS